MDPVIQIHSLRASDPFPHSTFFHSHYELKNREIQRVSSSINVSTPSHAYLQTNASFSSCSSSYCCCDFFLPCFPTHTHGSPFTRLSQDNKTAPTYKGLCVSMPRRHCLFPRPLSFTSTSSPSSFSSSFQPRQTSILQSGCRRGGRGT